MFVPKKKDIFPLSIPLVFLSVKQKIFVRNIKYITIRCHEDHEGNDDAEDVC